MTTKKPLSSIDVVILCGGKGTRLQSLFPEQPKVLAPINGRPFIDILIAYVQSFGVQRIILCAGYKKEALKKHAANKWGTASIVVSEEEEALGTAGALHNALLHINSSSVLVLNGDSFCTVDLNAFYAFHQEKQSVVSVALVNDVAYRDACGSVEINGECRIRAFREKDADVPDGVLYNAGIYLLEKECITQIPPTTPCSLEYDVFPALCDNRCYGFVTDQPLIEIGTPERYYSAVEYFNKK